MLYILGPAKFYLLNFIEPFTFNSNIARHIDDKKSAFYAYPTKI